MFTVVIPVLNQHESTRDCIQTWLDHSVNRLDILFIDNGSSSPLEDQPFIKEWRKDHQIRVIRNEKNVGVYPTFKQGLEATDSEFIFYSHNDVEMKDFGWDAKIEFYLRSLKSDGKKPGVCGMFGAKGIGTPDIYKSPYNFTQMMRWDCYTVASMMHAGSKEVSIIPERIMVLDGFSLIVSREMIESVGFDDGAFPPHHNYDNDICLTSHYAGYQNFVLDVDCHHLGGVTSTREKWAEEMNTTDLKVHRLAHKIFYEKWRGKLPASVK